MSPLVNITSASDEVLVKLILNGQKSAWEEVYDRYFDILFRFSFGYTKDEAKAEDVVQDIFIELPKKLEKFDTNRQFRTWLFSLTANRCKNLIRNTENQARLNRGMEFSTTFHSSAEREMDLTQLRNEIRQVLSGCSEKEQELYRLRFEMDLSVKEISSTLNIPEGSVKSGLFYLLKKIRTPIKKISHEYR